MIKIIQRQVAERPGKRIGQMSKVGDLAVNSTRKPQLSEDARS